MQEIPGVAICIIKLELNQKKEIKFINNERKKALSTFGLDTTLEKLEAYYK